ncbi:ankycorbin-like [Ctenocephalides felis]|uniref:ankycorbin-like n=1 Tax=Ctenocephalides felis TaxID=7515 RepID=UPI000E6E3F91|nr:ankycorbin-like [Ctenocephalides felis]
MSDTDDTDALLVISPDTFLVNFDSDSGITLCEKPPCVVDVMINHVDDLRHKLSQLNAQLCGESQNNYSLQYTHKFRSAVDYTSCPNMASNDVRNTNVRCQDGSKMPLPNQSLYSEIPSMFSDISSISNFPHANYADDRLLLEIDNFLTKTVAGFEKQKFVKTTSSYSRALGNDNHDSKENDCAKNSGYCFSFVPELQLPDSNRATYSSECTDQKQSVQELYNGEITLSKNLRSKEYDTSKANYSKLSLEKLWNFEYKDSNMEQESEKLRREHCEQEIQLLQTKLLESQEKLAVAIKVDKAKDNAINQLKLAWQRLANNYENRDIQLNALMNNMQKERQLLENEKQIYVKSCATHKEEITSSYELVKSLKEKLLIFEKAEQDLKMCEMETSRRYISMSLQNTELLYNGLLKEKNELNQQNEELSRTVDTLRNEIENEHKNFVSEETKCKTLVVKCANLESENHILIEEKKNLKNKLSQEQEKNNRLEILKRNLNSALDESKLREGKLSSEVKIIKKQLETQKKELKEFYQNQVETVVKEKMQEFQTQLEFAEKCMEAEIQKREQTLMEKLMKQIQSLIQQSELEVNLLKEKHKEEMGLCKLQLKSTSQHNSILKEKLSNYYAKRGKIAEQLHKVMENQWQAALQIISSPTVLDKNSDNDLNGIMSARSNFDADDLKTINYPEKDIDKLENDSSIKPILKKNSLMVISTPVSSRNVPNENDLEAYLKQFLLHASENKQNSSDWQKVSQSTPKLKNFLEQDDDSKSEAGNVYFKNLK